MNAQELINRHSHVIVFDGVCNVCAGWVKFVYKRDTEGRFLSPPYNQKAAVP